MRIALGVAYDGRGFAGWQSQPSGNTVQDRLETALSAVAGAPVRAVAAGRTDAGVHALGQVVHFDTAAERPETAWVRGTNAALPEAIAVQWACRVADDFHARFCAAARTYRYVLYNHPVRPALLAGRVGWFHRPLDVGRMSAGAAGLLGTHDFSAFRSAECAARSPVRTIERVAVARHADFILFEFVADAFLHHMVRNLVGALVQIGKGAAPPEWLAEVLAGRDRSRGAPTFAPDGLYLARVAYPERWRLPPFPPMLPEPFGASP